MRKRVFDFLRRASKLFYLNSSNEDLEMTKVIVRFVSIFNCFSNCSSFYACKAGFERTNERNGTYPGQPVAGNQEVVSKKRIEVQVVQNKGKPTGLTASNQASLDVYRKGTNMKNTNPNQALVVLGQDNCTTTQPRSTFIVSVASGQGSSSAHV